MEMWPQAPYKKRVAVTSVVPSKIAFQYSNIQGSGVKSIYITIFISQAYVLYTYNWSTLVSLLLVAFLHLHQFLGYDLWLDQHLVLHHRSLLLQERVVPRTTAGPLSKPPHRHLLGLGPQHLP